MQVAEKFIRALVAKYGNYLVYTDVVTWYPEACNVLRLKHCLHSTFLKSLIERVNQYFKDRTDGFDNYYPCIRNQCTLFYVQNIIQLFICMFNNVTTTGNDFNFEFNGGEITLA